MNAVVVTPSDVRIIVDYYFKEQLALKGIQWTTERTDGPLSERHGRYVSVLNELSSYVRSNATAFSEIRTDTQRVVSLLDRQNEYNLNESGFSVFACIAEHLFSDGIRWHHLMTLFVFSVELAHDLSQTRNRESLIGNVADWLIAYSADRLLEWINDHKGWDGLVDFYNQSQAAASSSTRSFWQTAMLVAGGSLAYLLFHLASKP